ncbi:MAG: hypothetical protein V4695_08595 [Pseudomonadota bacterium]
MPTVRPPTVVVLNPGIAGELPPLNIGKREGAATSRPSDPATPPNVDAIEAPPNTPVPAGLQNLQQQANRQRRNRNVAAASLITVGTASGVATLGFFANTVVRAVGANAVEFATGNMVGRFAACAFGAGAATGLIASGAVLTQAVRATPAQALELPAWTSQGPFQGPIAELQEIVIEVEGANTPAEASAPDVAAVKHNNTGSA